MNPLKMLLLVFVSTGLAWSAFAIERTHNPDTPAPAAERPAESDGVPGAEIPAAAEPGLLAAASYRLASVAPIRYAAADGSRIGARAVTNPGITAPNTGRAASAPGSSRVPAAVMSEPSEWMQLLCGLVVAGFIARRRTSLAAG